MTDQTVETTASEATTADASPAVADAGKAAAPRDTGVQKRINELTRARYDAERRAAAAEAKLAESSKTKPADDDSAVKTLADFDYDETAYQKHIHADVEKRASTAAEKAVEAREKTQAKAAAEKARIDSWKNRTAEYAKVKVDFAEKVYSIPDAYLNDTVFEALTESEVGPEVAYYLAENLDEAERISNLSPAAAARAIGRLESKFEAKAEAKAEVASEEAKPKDEPRTTKAPAPPPKLDASNDVVKKDPADMSQKEFNTWRRRQIAQRR